MTLRAVAPGETAPPKPAKSMTVAQAAKTGTARDLLVAQRDRIAKAVDSPKCPPRDLAALTRRLQDIVDKLVALDAADEEAAAHEDVEDGSFDAAAV